MVLGVLILSLLGLVYTYLGYPLLIACLARLRPSPIRPAVIEPTVSILVVAYNEAERIRARLENLFSLDYPGDRLEILIASDGSSDDTVARIRNLAGQRVRVVEFPTRRGKAAVLNDMVPRSSGEILVFADVRQTIDEQAIRELVVPFAEPRVGAVSGELVLRESRSSGAPTAAGVGAYWKYEKWIRESESLYDSTVGATGALYAIRRELFQPIPEDTLLDDVLIPMRISRRGFRVLFRREARAYDLAAAGPREEFTRKVRTIAGNFQLFARESWLWKPTENRLLFQLFSHKGLRLGGPLLLALCLLTSAFLPDPRLRGVSLLLQGVFYTCAVAGFAGRTASLRLPLLAIPYVFCLLNLATIVAFARFVRRDQAVTWDRATDNAQPG